MYGSSAISHRPGRALAWAALRVSLTAPRTPTAGGPTPCPSHRYCNHVVTFYWTRSAIQAQQPTYFLLANVGGVTMRQSSGDTTPPLYCTRDGPTHGLCTVKAVNVAPLYTVQHLRGVCGWMVGMPQARPRTLFFGCKRGLSHTAEDILRTFHGFVRHCNNQIWSVDARSCSRLATQRMSYVASQPVQWWMTCISIWCIPQLSNGGQRDGY